MRTANRRLFGGVWRWAGTYRLREKNIGIDPLHIAVSARALLADARYWADHGTYPPLEAAARLHHRLVSIHPFPNGNGRHARIVADLYLTEHFGSPAIAWADGFALDAAGARREAYIRALRAADGGNLDPLLEFVGHR